MTKRFGAIGLGILLLCFATGLALGEQTTLVFADVQGGILADSNIITEQSYEGGYNGYYNGADQFTQVQLAQSGMNSNADIKSGQFMDNPGWYGSQTSQFFVSNNGLNTRTESGQWQLMKNAWGMGGSQYEGAVLTTSGLRNFNKINQYENMKNVYQGDQYTFAGLSAVGGDVKGIIDQKQKASGNYLSQGQTTVSDLYGLTAKEKIKHDLDATSYGGSISQDVSGYDNVNGLFLAKLDIKVDEDAKAYDDWWYGAVPVSQGIYEDADVRAIGFADFKFKSDQDIEHVSYYYPYYPVI